MPRFSILIHDHPFLHWDFLLERGDSCRTWRLLRSPDEVGPIPAEQLPDHRLMYLDYEGPVSNERGSVTIWDAGSFEWTTDLPDVVDVRLNGGRVQGEFRLVLGAEGWVMTRGAEG